MKKKPELQPELRKLKLDKEKIMALTIASAEMIKGGENGIQYKQSKPYTNDSRIAACTQSGL